MRSAKHAAARANRPTERRGAADRLGSASAGAGEEAGYPAHDAELPSLARIEGQVRGLQKMIEDRRYCMDILTQTRSIHAALHRVERNILKRHLETCVQRALCGKSAEERREKIEEILALFQHTQPR